jgi:hypothetical protein
LIFAAMARYDHLPIWKDAVRLTALLVLLAVAWPARAACTAGNPNGNMVETTPTGAFVDNANRSVTHALTGLMWKQCAEGLSGAGCATGTATTMTWANALATATSANAANFAGYNDWRLPNKKELLSIVEFCGYSPAINQTIFPNTPASNFWSGSSYVPLPMDAWVVDFGYVITFANHKKDNSYARLVRGGQSFDTFDALGSTASAVALSVASGGVAANQATFVAGSNDVLSFSATIQAGGSAGTASDLYFNVDIAGYGVFYLGPSLVWGAAAPIISGFRLVDINAPGFYRLAIAGLPATIYTFSLIFQAVGSSPSSAQSTLAKASVTVVIAPQDIVVPTTTTLRPQLCTYAVTPANQAFGDQGGNGNFNVTATQAGCTPQVWAINAPPGWINNVNNNGNGSVAYTVSRNAGVARNDVITISFPGGNANFAVTQAGAPLLCVYAVAPTSRTFDSLGGNGSFNVQATVPGCVPLAWVISFPAWLVSLDNLNGSVSYTVSPNTATAARNGAVTITFAGGSADFTVTQSGAAPFCTYAVTPTTWTFGAEGGSGSFNVKQVESTCTSQTWTMASSAGITNVYSYGMSGGNGSVAYSVSPNPNPPPAPRNETVTINFGLAAAIFSVRQTGANPFQGVYSGRWSGTCSYGFTVSVSGTFKMSIDSNGGVTGTYLGSDSGNISGSVNVAGALTTVGKVDSSTSGGGITWSGSFAAGGAATRRWVDSGGCQGSWVTP